MITWLEHNKNYDIVLPENASKLFGSRTASNNMRKLISDSLNISTDRGKVQNFSLNNDSICKENQDLSSIRRVKLKDSNCK